MAIHANSTPAPRVRARRSVTNAKPNPLIPFQSLDDIPDRYAMVLAGLCLEPELKDGTILGFSRSEPYAVGDFCIFILRPELVPPGRHQTQIKRLFMSPPPRTRLPYREHPDSQVHSLVIAEQLNPPRRFAIECQNLIAIHKCTGRVLPTAETAGLAEQLVAARRRASSRSAS